MTRTEALELDERDLWFAHIRDDLPRGCPPIEEMTATSGLVHSPQGYPQPFSQVDPSTDPHAYRATVEHMNPSEMVRVRHVLGLRRQRHGYFLVTHGGRLERQNPVAVEWVIRLRGSRRKAA